MKDCNQCGKCCIKYGDGGLSATANEIEDWEMFTPEIARYVHNGEIWMHPETGEPLTRCPWLRVAPNENPDASARYECDIYLNRPADCRHYPTSIDEMLRDECEMIEVKDLSNRKQAQRELDTLMEDSRPPLL